MPVTKTRKLPRVVRLDGSDVQLFAKPASPGEWAVSGGFEFLETDPALCSGKHLQAFKSGFLGVGSFGRTTLVAITQISDAEFRSVVQQLAVHLLDHYHAPDLAAAEQAADEEVRYAESLCEYDVNTLLAVDREFTEEGICERFKKFIPADAGWEQAKPLVYVKEE